MKTLRRSSQGADFIKPVHMIAAVGRSGQIGLKGAIPWTNLDGMGWLRETTIGCAVIIGRKTVSSMPTLIGRDVIVFDSSISPANLIENVSSGPYRKQPIFIAGGGHVYRVFAPFVNGLRLINHVDYDGEADTWFPFEAYNMQRLPASHLGSLDGL